MEGEKTQSEESPKISSILPYLSICILGLSILKQYIFYTYFHIPIHYFLGISDIGFIIMGDIINIILGNVMPIILLQFIFLKKLDNVVMVDKNIKVVNTISLIVISIILVLTMVLDLTYFKDKFYKFIDFLNLMGYIIMLSLALIVLVQKSNSRQRMIRVAIIFAIGMAIYSLLYFSLSEINSVRKGKYSGTIIQTKDSTYISSKTNYFIGKTDKFAFMYNSNDSTSTIIPMAEVKTIKFKYNIVKY